MKKGQLELLKDLKILQEKGMVEIFLDQKDKKMKVKLTDKGWLFYYYDKVIHGEEVPQEILVELRKRVRFKYD